MQLEFSVNKQTVMCTGAKNVLILHICVYILLAKIDQDRDIAVVTVEGQYQHIKQML